LLVVSRTRNENAGEPGRLKLERNLNQNRGMTISLSQKALNVHTNSRRKLGKIADELTHQGFLKSNCINLQLNG
jgi:hypothetical protein